MKLINEFKEMKYQRERTLKTLASGQYKGYEFRILNLGTHPTAYVNLPTEHCLYGKTYNEIYEEGIDIDVHGGLTYSRTVLSTENTELSGWWIGWDYAHYGDYAGYEVFFHEKLRLGGKKWTTSEIYEDVKRAIEQLIEVNNA